MNTKKLYSIVGLFLVLSFVFSSLVAYSSPGLAVSENLIACWDMEEASGNRADALGTYNLTGVPQIPSTTGIVNTAADFVSSSYFLYQSTLPGTNYHQSDFTISTWARINTSKGFSRGFLGQTHTSGAQNYELIYDQPTDSFSFKMLGGLTGQVYDTTSPTVDTWYHLIAWYDATAGEIGIQVNNSTPITTTTSGSPSAAASYFKVGFGVNTLTPGSIDTTVLHSKILSAAERATLYNSGAGQTCAAIQADPTATPTYTPTASPTATPTATPDPTAITLYEVDLPSGGRAVVSMEMSAGEILILGGMLLLSALTLFTLARDLGHMVSKK